MRVFPFLIRKKTIQLKNCRFSGGCIGNPDNEEGRCCGGSWIWENGVKTNKWRQGCGGYSGGRSAIEEYKRGTGIEKIISQSDLRLSKGSNPFCLSDLQGYSNITGQVPGRAGWVVLPGSGEQQLQSFGQ